MRLHLFEFEDHAWFPDVVRKGGTDYLRYLLQTLDFYRPVTPVIRRVLDECGQTQILDLCSGAGGNMHQVADRLCDSDNKPLITLSDKFPNIGSFAFVSNMSNGRIVFRDEPVDALNIQNDLEGMLTMFSAIHHFKPTQIKNMLKGVAKNKRSVAFFDGGDKNLLSILAILVFHPIGFFLFTPFFKPFQLSRVFFTYLLPLIPLYTIWDGCVSVLRLYRPKDLLAMAKEAAPEYQWEAGYLKSKFGLKVCYLVGYP